MKRRGNRRYYQHHEVLLIRKIRELLYDQGFTISGARNQLMDARINGVGVGGTEARVASVSDQVELNSEASAQVGVQSIRHTLQEVLMLLKGSSGRL
jgi:DNA-binding transcriptional MerR regulator